MTSEIKKIFSSIIAFIFLFGPTIVFATSEYTLLEPSIVGKDPGTQSPGLMTYLSWLYNTFFVFIAIAAFALIVWGGFEYIASSIPSIKSSGKTKIIRALQGLGLALVSWLILETISAGTFTNINISLEGVGGVGNSAGPAGNNTSIPRGNNAGQPSGVPNSGGNTTNSTGAIANSATNLSEQDARNQVQQMGYSVNHANSCNNGQTSGCTNLEGLQPETMAGLQTMRDRCPNCDFVITAGTEHGDSTMGTFSHRNGYKIDFRDNDAANTYFTTNGFVYRRTRSDGARVYTNGNVTAAREPDHWDVTFTP
jgi:hypothetical protein